MKPGPTLYKLIGTDSKLSLPSHGPPANVSNPGSLCIRCNMPANPPSVRRLTPKSDSSVYESFANQVTHE